MAQKRHGNVVLWILLGILVSPLIIAIILLAIGNSEKDKLRNLCNDRGQSLDIS